MIGDLKTDPHRDRMSAEPCFAALMEQPGFPGGPGG